MGSETYIRILYIYISISLNIIIYGKQKAGKSRREEAQGN
jgi:hypothetical protein